MKQKQIHVNICIMPNVYLQYISSIQTIHN